MKITAGSALHITNDKHPWWRDPVTLDRPPLIERTAAGVTITFLEPEKNNATRTTRIEMTHDEVTLLIHQLIAVQS